MNNTDERIHRIESIVIKIWRIINDFPLLAEQIPLGDWKDLENLLIAVKEEGGHE